MPDTAFRKSTVSFMVNDQLVINRWRSTLVEEAAAQSLFAKMFPFEVKPLSRKQHLILRIRDMRRRISNAWLVLTGKAEICDGDI